ncbi:DUF2065 domain-containing protein [Mariprofundus ferrooxydans]|uniref:DUF2065 domain-containing protein n=1 Tax=Mariprofundus ferrooxydans PV-1 TaxID=314345 RepID=Q0F3A1_9PROT|nr:DUF2065 domain-containing protein [Mariprofundus ferrooxydans]EAU56040.1 hypothetical protein SPV1_04448 [Mariprofundus ferrooxydans PV-1]KON46627.1 hypothetical protein AL013_11980 [Mariprofundus ferrooxydans]
MDDLLAALGLVLVLEGAFYALFPQGMINMMRRIPDIPPASLRLMGIVAVAIGWVIVKVVRN